MTTYLYYPEASEIREQPRMAEPDFRDYDQGEQYHNAKVDYENHITFLKSYHTEGFTSQYEGRELVENVDFRLTEKNIFHPPNKEVLGNSGVKDASNGWWPTIIAISIEQEKEILSSELNDTTNNLIQCSERCKELGKELELTKAENERLNKLINNPQILDFIESVKIEVAHQYERWGDETLVPPHHFSMVLSYIIGKLNKAIFDRDTDKFLHHLITLAAVSGCTHKYFFTKESEIDRWFKQKRQ